MNVNSSLILWKVPVSTDAVSTRTGAVAVTPERTEHSAATVTMCSVLHLNTRSLCGWFSKHIAHSYCSIYITSNVSVYHQYKLWEEIFNLKTVLIWNKS